MDVGSSVTRSREDFIDIVNVNLADTYVRALKKSWKSLDYIQRLENFKDEIRGIDMNADANDVFHVLLPPNREPSNFFDFKNLSDEEARRKLIHQVEQAKKDGHRRFFIFIEDEANNKMKTMVVNDFATKHNCRHFSNRLDPRCQILVLQNLKSSCIYGLEMVICCFILAYGIMTVVQIFESLSYENWFQDQK